MAGATEDPLNVTAADVAAPEKPAEEPEPAPEVVPPPAETVEPVTAAPETNGALPFDDEETEPFSDEIKYISRARPGGPKESPYAFVVVGEVLEGMDAVAALDAMPVVKAADALNVEAEAGEPVQGLLD